MLTKLPERGEYYTYPHRHFVNNWVRVRVIDVTQPRGRRTVKVNFMCPVIGWGAKPDLEVFMESAIAEPYEEYANRMRIMERMVGI